MLNVGELVATLSVRFERNIDILVPLKKKKTRHLGKWILGEQTMKTQPLIPISLISLIQVHFEFSLSSFLSQTLIKGLLAYGRSLSQNPANT